MQKLIFRNSKGDEINLTSGNFGITTWEGFSNTSINIQSQQVPMQDGSVYLDALLENRELSVTVAINDNNDLSLRYELKRQIISMMNPKFGEGYLIYENDFISKRIKCIPNLPIFENKNSNDTGTLKCNCTWTACEPYWEDLEETSINIDLGSQKKIENEGDVPCQVKIDLFLGNNNNNITLKNLSNGKSLKLYGNFNDKIHIDTSLGNKIIENEHIKFNMDYCSNDLYGVTYSENLGIFVAVGSSGTILTSPDGINWTSRTSGITSILRGVTYSDELNLFAVVGNSGTILTSPDGIDWTQRNSGVNIDLYDTIYSQELNLFVAVGKENTILRSSDGITWVDVLEHDSENELYSITYSQELNLFVAVGGNRVSLTQAKGIILTSSDGITWLEQDSGYELIADGFVRIVSVCYSEELSLFICSLKHVTSGSSNPWSYQTLISSDGITWNQIYNYTNMDSICYSEELNLFIGVGNIQNEFNIWRSKTGKSQYTWIGCNNEILNDLNSIIYSKGLGLFVAVGNGGTILTSPDGVDWEKENDSKMKDYKNTIIINSITYSDELNLFVVVGNSGTILTSPDGVDWVSRTSGVNVDLYDVIYSQELNLFIAVGDIRSVSSGDIQTILTSPDGINWTIRTQGLSGSYSPHKIIENLNTVNRFVTINNYGTSDSNLYFSSDGITWEMRDSFTLKINGYYHLENSAIVVGNSGVILKRQYENWVQQTSGVNVDLNSITYSDELNLFVVVGSSGVIITSPDGMDWTSRTSGVNVDLYDVTYSDELNLFIAVGNGGTILTSPDGINWIRKETDTDNHLKKVISFNDVICSLGSNIILKSYFSKGENIISFLSDDSDMTFNLEVGMNKLVLTRQLGELNGRVTYRQKYLGV